MVKESKTEVAAEVKEEKEVKVTKKAATKKAAPKKAAAPKAEAVKEEAPKAPKASKKAKKEEAPKAAKKYQLPTTHDYAVIIKPVVTEKSLRLMQTENKITLRVSKDSNSTEIKQAFESIFNKKVARVNIVNVRSREKHLGRFVGEVGSYKKAIVKLAPGETLDLFQEDEKKK